MALPEQYLITTKNLEAFLTSLLSAQAPDRFTQKFLESLEFKSTNDRLMLGTLKMLKFIDSNGAPSQIYFEYLDQSQSKEVLGKAIKDAYDDLFKVNKDAHKLTKEEVKSKFKTLTQGKKSDKIYGLMANTFKALCDNATFTKHKIKKDTAEPVTPVAPEQSSKPKDSAIHQDQPVTKLGLSYNIQIHLPETRDTAVFDAIFQSLKTHLVD